MNLPKIKAPEVIRPSLRICGAFFWTAPRTWSLEEGTDVVLSWWLSDPSVVKSSSVCLLEWWIPGLLWGWELEVLLHWDILQAKDLLTACPFFFLLSNVLLPFLRLTAIY